MSLSKILLIEPDMVLARVYKDYLEQCNHEVRLSATSQQAINRIDEDLPDVIILETQLAGHNGYEFLYELRSYPEWQKIPVIIHSISPINILNNNPLTAHELGVSDYLYKPDCTLARLSYSVEHHLLAV